MSELADEIEYKESDIDLTSESMKSDEELNKEFFISFLGEEDKKKYVYYKKKINSSSVIDSEIIDDPLYANRLDVSRNLEEKGEDLYFEYVENGKTGIEKIINLK